MRTVIHRPYFLPWLGYFSKLAFADTFVVMDDVLFTKRHFIDRVQIISPQGEPAWLSLATGENYQQPCNTIRISGESVIERCMKSLSHSYARALHYRAHIGDVERILEEAFEHSSMLARFDTKIVELTLALLDIPVPRIVFGSEYGFVDDPTERLVSLCRATGSDVLIMGTGGSLDIHGLDDLRAYGIDIQVQDYLGHHPHYYQTRRSRAGFLPGLSVVDCLLNEGAQRTRRLVVDTKFEPIPWDA